VKRIGRYWDTAEKIVSSFFGSSDKNSPNIPVPKGTFQDIESIQLSPEVMREAAEKMKAKRPDGSFKDGYVNHKIVKKVAPWKKGKKNAGNDTNTKA